jgi:hypothetical protein
MTNRWGPGTHVLFRLEVKNDFAGCSHSNLDIDDNFVIFIRGFLERFLATETPLFAVFGLGLLL